MEDARSAQLQSYVTIEINGTEPATEGMLRPREVADLAEPLASSESKPSVVVSHMLMLDEDEPLPPMTFLMSDSLANATATANFTNESSREGARRPEVADFDDDNDERGEPSAEGAKQLVDVKNFMRLMRNSTSQWLSRSQASGVTTSKRPELSPKSRKFLQEIKSKRRLAQPPRLPQPLTSTLSTTTTSTSTVRPGTSAQTPASGSNLTESASSKHEKWVNYSRPVEGEEHSGLLHDKVGLDSTQDEEEEPLEESASTSSETSPRKTLRLSIERQHHEQQAQSAENGAGPVTLSESSTSTTTIDDGLGGSKTVQLRHRAPGRSTAVGDNKLPAKLREKIIEQFLRGGGDPQNIVVSDSTITTTSQSQKKTITTVYKIVPSTSELVTPGGNRWHHKSPAHYGRSRAPEDNDGTEHEHDDDHDHDQDDDEDREHEQMGPGFDFAGALKSHVSGKQQQRQGHGPAKRLKKIMVTRIEVPQRLVGLKQKHGDNANDATLGEFYAGPHESILAHMNQQHQAPDKRQSDDTFDWPQEEKKKKSHINVDKFLSDFEVKDDRSGQKTNDKGSNHLLPTLVQDETNKKGAQNVGKSARSKKLLQGLLKKSPSSTEATNVNSVEQPEVERPEAKVIKAVAPKTRKQNSRSSSSSDNKQGKPKSGRARATSSGAEDNQQLISGPPPLSSAEDTTEPPPLPSQQTEDPGSDPSLEMTTTRAPSVTNSRVRPTSSSPRRPQAIPNLTTKQTKRQQASGRPPTSPRPEVSQKPREASASVADTKSETEEAAPPPSPPPPPKASRAPARSLATSRRGGRQNATPTPTSTTTTSTTTTSTTTTSTTPRPRPRATTARARRPPSPSTTRAPATTTSTTTAPALVTSEAPTGDDGQVSLNDELAPEVAPKVSSPVAVRAQPLRSPASVVRSQQRAQQAAPAPVQAAIEPNFSLQTARANLTADVRSPRVAFAPQQQQLEQPFGRTRNIMMLIDFDAPPPPPAGGFNQPLDARESGDSTKVKSESFQSAFVSAPHSGHGQWRPLSFPPQQQQRVADTAVAAAAGNDSNSRQQAPTVSVQIYNNLAHDQQQQQQQQRRQQTPKIQPLDDFSAQQVAQISPPPPPPLPLDSGGESHTVQQHDQSAREPLRLELEAGDPFEDLAASMRRARTRSTATAGQSQARSPALRSLEPPPPLAHVPTDAMPFLFASSTHNHQHHQRARQHAHELRPAPSHAALLPGESAQTNQMLARVIDEISKSALASGYQVADSQQHENNHHHLSSGAPQLREALSTAANNGHVALFESNQPQTPSVGNVRPPGESEDYEDMDEHEFGPATADHTSAGSSMRFSTSTLLQSAAAALLAGGRRTAGLELMLEGAR